MDPSKGFWISCVHAWILPVLPWLYPEEASLHSAEAENLNNGARVVFDCQCIRCNQIDLRSSRKLLTKFQHNAFESQVPGLSVMWTDAPMVIPWLHPGYTLEIPWLQPGYTLVTPWFSPGYALIIPLVTPLVTP